jgi:putative ABC transport system ATP-binding protein
VRFRDGRVIEDRRQTPVDARDLAPEAAE